MYTDDFHADLLEAVSDAALPKSPSKDYGTRTDWGKVFDTMTTLYPNLDISREGLRSLYRRKHKTPPKVDVNLLFVDAVRRPRTVAALAEEFRISEADVYRRIVALQSAGYRGLVVWDENGTTYVRNITKARSGDAAYHMAEVTRGRDITFGVVSDTHMGSKYEALDELERFYDILAERGVTTVYHVGDISEGYYSNRPASIFDTHAVGFSEQVRHIVANYPELSGGTTYFITGNHDATHFRNGFADIGETISASRPDLVYLGHNFARIHLTEALTMSLVHPTDGAANTLSLKLQHLIDRNAGRRSDIMLVGHYHKSCGLKYRDVYGYLVPSFQHVTPFMSDNNLYSDVAGMIFTVRVDDNGKLLSIVTEYVDMS